MEGSENENADFQKKREQFTIGIRRQNREEIISKRRNLGNQQNNNDIETEENKISYVVDPRYEEYTRKFQQSRFHLQSLPELIKALYDQDIIKQHYGAIGIRRIMSLSDQPPIQAIIDTGIVPRLIEFINQEEYPQLQLQATWSLANVASGTPRQCQSIIDKGAIQFFIKLVKSPHPGIVEQAIWAIGNIASDSSFNRDACIRKGAIVNIRHFIENNSKKQLIEPSLWALSNLCRGSPPPNYEIVKQAVFTIGEYFPKANFKDEAVFGDCCWAISYNFPKTKSEIQKIITSQFVLEVTSKLNSYDYSLLVPIVRVIGHITKISNSYVEMVLQNKGIMDYFFEILGHEKKLLRLEISWVLSNIAVSSQDHINSMLGHQKLMGRLLQLFESDSDDVKKQICYLFANMASQGNPEIVFRFYKEVNIVKFYLQCLLSIEPRLVRDSLLNLHCIFKLGEKFKDAEENPFIIDLANLGGIDILQKLQVHDHTDVYDAVVKILKDFFEFQDTLNL